MKKQKILILTANFGAGHTTAANAIKNYLTNNNFNLSKDFDIIVENFIEASIPLLEKPLVKMYETTIKHFPLLYNAYYYTMKELNSKYTHGHYIFSKKLNSYIQNINPDLIISTFPQASACVNYLKEKKLISIPLVTVVTDVVMSNEWIHKNTDMYFVPSNEIKESFIKKGISNTKIKITGIPVSSNFFNICKDNSKNKYKIVFMGGARGLFNVSNNFIYWLDKFIDKKDDMVEVIIIAGKNKSLYNKFKNKKPLENILILGFVKNIDEIIKDCDLLITKPGGATLFESINAEIPIVVRKSSIGQEKYNANFIRDRNIGIVYKKEKELKILIKKLLNKNFDDSLKNIIFNIQELKDNIKPDNIELYIEELI